MSSYDLSRWPLFRSVLDDGASDAGKSAKCFVAGPFDSSDPAVRQHALSVWTYVVRPALLDTGFAPTRVETLESEDRIAKATVDDLLATTMGIVIASDHSFSIDYALSVNQAMKRPMIFLVEDGRTPAADVGEARIVSYNFRPDILMGPDNILALQSAIREVEETLNAPAAQPGPKAVQAAASAGPQMPRPPQIFSDDQRVALVKAARKRVDVMGIANLPLAVHAEMLEFACSDASRGLEIRVLQCAPNNPGLPPIVGARDVQQLAAVQGEIEAAAEAWRRIADHPTCKAAVTLRRTQTSVPLSSALITDRAMAATPYLFSRTPADGPTYIADAGSAEHDAMIEEFQTLWGEATTYFRSEPKPAAVAAAVQSAPPPPLSASFDPVQRVAPQPLAEAAPSAQPAPPSTAATAEESTRNGPAVLPPASPGLLKGFSSLRGVTSN